MGMFDDALKNAGRSCIMRAGTVAFCIVFPLDVATVYFLREAPALIVPQGFNGSMANSTTMDMFTLAVEPFEVDDFQVSWRWKDLLENLDDFDGDTVDVCLLLVLRIFMLLVLLGIGSCATRKKTEGPCCYPCADQSPPAERVAPLLINQATPAEEAPALTQLSHQADHQHVAAYNSNQRIALKKNLLSALMFVCSTTAQVYLGIKVIGFHGLWEESGEASTYAARIKTVQGLLFFTSVLIINVETVVATRLLDAMGMEDGFDVPALHQHRLFFKVINSHLCDLCRNPVNEVYRCDTCDFDICPACFNKKDKATGEGVMRGDKGVRDAVKLGRLNYVWRCLRLIGPYSPSFIFAMVCLLMQSVASLIMPNFQGQLFDHVIDALHSCTADPYSKACHDHRDGFFQIMGFYAGLSASLGLLVALRTLAFQIVARQINFGTRKQLFARAMRADIAFFDGMRTGDIQTRLDRDVTAMVFPIRTSLSTILANLTLLIGGLILCFRTSWRLSMLAFTTILPMMHITATYAGWSRKLNQAMNQHISDAISRSGEAVNNIRTVRACSAEAFEIAHNDKTVNRALLSGIKDAIGAGVSAALNDYLELGAGVLILWYGGTMAMEPHGSITVGQLITYQLYWNIINTAVQALNDNITTFTRAAGSAERVLSLFDLTPDIDPDGGTHVEAAVTRWSIEFVDVEFHYQMRPNLKVLTGMSFAVPAGKVGALVGRSGGGKSTMIHLLLRFYDPRAGCIRLGGVDLREINIATMHHFVGVVSQETQMFNGTILESMRTEADALRLAASVTLLILCVRAPRLWTDLAYSIEDPSTEEIEEATKAAQCFDFIASFDDGLSTRVGERGQRLSGGQKQRIAIARCLLRKPRMLLLDEATSVRPLSALKPAQLSSRALSSSRVCVVSWRRPLMPSQKPRFRRLLMR